MATHSQDIPAFPHVRQSKASGSSTIYTHVSEGMKLRDWFAGQALAGIASAGLLSWDQMAVEAYGAADAMLAARGQS